MFVSLFEDNKMLIFV